jgi:two-component system NtrC family response regulator
MINAKRQESAMKSLLVIDDEPGHRLMVRAVLEDVGWRVFEAASGEEALAFFNSREKNAQVALLDMNMPGMDGHATLTRLQGLHPDLPVILLTAYGTVGSAVEAMKCGAFDYLTKPTDNDELILTLNRAWEYSRLREENIRLRDELTGKEALDSLVGESAPMRTLREFIRQAGPSEATVLITGESGTGKELIAEALHACGERSKKALVKVNCAALPSQLLESELFGYERGAFTGALKDKPGRFQLASGGTLFLDEIGEMPLDLQAKLLRILHDRVVEPLGSVRPIPVDVRILAATNKNLAQAVASGEFREDLFFRLNVLEVEAPPLRERLDDLPLLVSRLLARLAKKNHMNIRRVSPAFLQRLSAYSWPGNIRELKNVLERALILSRSDVLDSDSLPKQILQADPAGFTPGRAFRREMPPASNTVPEGPPWLPAKDMPAAGIAPSPLEDAERKALINALHACKGHREKTAEALGISRRSLQYKLRKFGLNRRG